jgi:hypothetical protein
MVLERVIRWREETAESLNRHRRSILSDEDVVKAAVHKDLRTETLSLYRKSETLDSWAAFYKEAHDFLDLSSDDIENEKDKFQIWISGNKKKEKF